MHSSDDRGCYEGGWDPASLSVSVSEILPFHVRMLLNNLLAATTILILGLTINPNSMLSFHRLTTLTVMILHYSRLCGSTGHRLSRPVGQLLRRVLFGW